MIYLKTLALKQDNEKNQIMLGRDVAELINVFPGKLSLRQPSQSELKRKSDPGRPITEASLTFSWMDARGQTFAAPGARLIDYFQYPEARLSGFLTRCKWAPDAIRRDKQAKYGSRVLFLGANNEGRIFATLLTERDDPLVRSLPDFPSSGVSNVLRTLPVDGEGTVSPAHILELKLAEIINCGWHPSVRNRGGEIIPFKGNQGAGYTLEALLGIVSNSLKEPDILGHEVKTFGKQKGKISLMTPVADLGPEAALTFREFMRRYGHPAKKDDGSVRFTGTVKFGSVNERNGLTLRLKGYDPSTDRFSSDPEEIRVELFRPSDNQVVSGWSLQKLADSWTKKHAFAVYVPSEAHSELNKYRFLQPLYFCSGTSVWHFLRTVARGNAYYDPGHAIYANGTAKQRPQWRISVARLQEKLASLYDEVNITEA